MPLVSVIIPTRNRASLLGRAVKSALAATRDLEVIVVDDSSTDDTPSVCAQLPVRYIRLDSNLGSSSARNAGVLASSSPFVSFLDDDNLRLPATLDAQVSLLETSPDAAFIYGRFLFADPKRQLPTGEIQPQHYPSGDIFWELLKHNFIATSTVVARRENVVDCGLFKSELNRVEDWEMWLRLAERSVVVAYENPVAIVRKADAASRQMSSNPIAMYRDMLKVQEMSLKLPRAQKAAASTRRRLRRRLVNQAYAAMIWHAQEAMLERNSVVAREKFREAARLRPIHAALSGTLLRYLMVPYALSADAQSTDRSLSK